MAERRARRSDGVLWPGLRHIPILAAALLTAPAWPQQPAPVDAQTQGSLVNGQRIFETRCVACHSLDSHRVGPALGTVFGRLAGKSPGYEYSNALRRARHRWDQEKLRAWLTDPEALVVGQAMGYRMEQEQDRRDVVAFLASLAPKR